MTTPPRPINFTNAKPFLNKLLNFERVYFSEKFNILVLSFSHIFDALDFSTFPAEEIWLCLHTNNIEVKSIFRILQTNCSLSGEQTISITKIISLYWRYCLMMRTESEIQIERAIRHRIHLPFRSKRYSKRWSGERVTWSMVNGWAKQRNLFWKRLSVQHLFFCHVTSHFVCFGVKWWFQSKQV